MKRGVTLIELVVAMGIFLVVVTVAVGAFVTVSRMKALTSTMKEATQKTRIASEMITRLARQGDKVMVQNQGKSLEIYYNTGIDASFYGYRFFLNNGDLSYAECPIGSPAISLPGYVCNWSNLGSSTLSGGVLVFDDTSVFQKTGTIPSRLNVDLAGKIQAISSNPYYSNDFTIKTAVILEGLR